MNDRVRLDQIRALRDRLERLPASPQRDRILEDVRRRAVDIESDMPTAPMRPLVADGELRLPEPPVPTQSRARPKRRATPPTPHARVRTDFARTRTIVADAHTATPLLEGVRLCLDDDVAVSPLLDGRRPTAHWARGLRG